jgi:hypothetical protein
LQTSRIRKLCEVPGAVLAVPRSPSAGHRPPLHDEEPVMKMDDVHTEERLEDLRIISPGQGWTALAEVKGYGGGAKSNDLLKFGRYWLRYFQEEGKEPDAGWYIVNQFFENDPSRRRTILSGSESALSTFDADYNGLAIDTAHLFRLWMAVRDGRLTAEDTRSRLMQAGKRFTFED